MSTEKDIYTKSTLSTFRPAIAFIVVPFGFILESIIEAPFFLFLTLDNLFNKKK